MSVVLIEALPASQAYDSDSCALLQQAQTMYMPSEQLGLIMMTKPLVTLA